MENPIKMDDFGVPLFLERPISNFKSKNFRWVTSSPSLDDGEFRSFVMWVTWRGADMLCHTKQIMHFAKQTFDDG